MRIEVVGKPLLTHYIDDTIIEPASQNVCYLSNFLRGKIFASHITDLSALYIKRALKLIKEERLTVPMKKMDKGYEKIYSQIRKVYLAQKHTLIHI